MPRKEWRRVANGVKLRKMSEKKTIKMEEKMNGKLGKTKEKLRKPLGK